MSRTSEPAASVPAIATRWRARARRYRANGQQILEPDEPEVVEPAPILLQRRGRAIAITQAETDAGSTVSHGNDE